jgi:hypothetical protein
MTTPRRAKRHTVSFAGVSFLERDARATCDRQPRRHRRPTRRPPAGLVVRRTRGRRPGPLSARRDRDVGTPHARARRAHLRARTALHRGEPARVRALGSVSRAENRRLRRGRRAPGRRPGARALHDRRRLGRRALRDRLRPRPARARRRHRGGQLAVAAVSSPRRSLVAGAPALRPPRPRAPTSSPVAAPASCASSSATPRPSPG